MYQKEESSLLLGRGRELQRVPDDGFIVAMQQIPQRMAKRLAFMTREHHTVRDCLVREIPRQSRAIPVSRVAQCLGMRAGQVSAIVTELEQRLFFLVRDAAGDVSWAYPVTTEATRHVLTFSTGEKTFGA
jgi:hypothetical protein